MKVLVDKRLYQNIFIRRNKICDDATLSQRCHHSSAKRPLPEIPQHVRRISVASRTSNLGVIEDNEDTVDGTTFDQESADASSTAHESL